MPLFLIHCLLAVGFVRAVPISHYLPLTSARAEQSGDLTPADVHLLVAGQSHPIDQIRLVGPSISVEGDPAAARLFVIHIDRRLGFREDFRSRRWVKKLIRHLDPSRDFIAVHRSGVLSHFSSEPAEIERLVDYFGTEFDRFNFGPERTRDRRWFQRSRWPFGPHHVSSSKQTSGADPVGLLNRKIRGSLRDSLSALRSMPGRKVLLHFGKTLPFLSGQVEFHDLDSSIHWAFEAGLDCYAVVPTNHSEGVEPDPALKAWVSATGGRLYLESEDLIQNLQTIFSETEYSLVVEFDPPRKLTGEFIPYALEVATPSGSLSENGGYFDLVESDFSIHERAFLTVGLQEHPRSEPPLTLEAEPSEFRGLIVELKFPLELIQFELIERGPHQIRRIFQEVYVFLGLYGDQDQLLDFAQDRFEVELDQNEIREFFPRNASLKRVLESRTLAEPVKIRAAVVAGQGRQMSSREITLP